MYTVTLFQTGDYDTYHINVSFELIESKCYYTDRRIII